MFVAFNLILIALVALIAYWWVNQGLFSAVLHFACVVVAGALAFAVWEPLAVLMLQRNFLVPYAWGIALLAPFALFLFLTRLACDKLVPDNLNFPQWAHYAFGGIFGIASGVLTMGMVLIGGGFVQSAKDVMGFEGVIRTVNSRGQPDTNHQSLWVPMHTITERFYATLSAGALAPEFGPSMGRVYPGIADVAFGMHRDSFASGKARTSIQPNGVSLRRFFYSSSYKNPNGPPGAWIVELEFGMPGTDSGGVFSISASQIRLIERVPAGENRMARAAHPVEWSQPNDVGTGLSIHPFDDVTSYATNVPGQQSTRIFFAFPADRLGGAQLNNPPAYVQVKGLRIALTTPPEQRDFEDPEIRLVMRGSDAALATDVPLTDDTKKMIRPSDLVSDYTIFPGMGAVGTLGSIEHSQNYLTFGKDTFPKGGRAASPTNRVKGIYSAEGTSVLRLNISRGDSSIDVWNARSEFRKEAGEGAPLLLVDSEGATYAPVGYFWETNDSVEISLPREGIQTIGEFPFQPSGGNHRLMALYRITVGRKIVSVRLGTIVLANCDFTVEAQTKR
jgi:hypothetical protein